MNWIDINDRLPDTTKIVLGQPEKGALCITFYTKGHEVEYEDYDYNGEYDPVEEQKGSLLLKEGWYEELEQVNGEYDVCYMKRKITHWMPLPEKPTGKK